MRPIAKTAAILAAFWLLTAAAFCREVRAEVRALVNVSPGAGTVEDIFEMEIAVYGDPTGSAGDPKFEESPHFTVNSIGESVKHLIVNGDATSVRTYRYQLIPKLSLKPGTYTGPKSYFELRGRRVYLSQPKIDITSTGSRLSAADLNIEFTQRVTNPTPYFGEQVLYEATVISKHPGRNANLSEIEYDGFWSESFEDQAQVAKELPGGAKLYTLRTALFPVRSGEIRLPERALTIELQIQRPVPRRRGYDPLFGHFPDVFDRFYQAVSKRLVAEPITVNVRPLPPAPAGSQSYIPVGMVSIASAVDKKLVPLGEGVTMTIDFYGNANLRPLTLPEHVLEKARQDFKIYEDEPVIERFIERGQIFFRKKFTLALVPKRSGKLALPKFDIAIFDPKAEQYTTLEAPERILHVTPPLDEESLVVSAPEGTGEDVKQNVTMLGEDLLPQHRGSGALKPAPRFSSAWIVTLLLLFPALGACGHWYAVRLARLHSDPALAARRNAFANASAVLKRQAGSAAAVEPLLSAARGYIGDRFGRTGQSLTSAEIREIVERNTRDAELARELATVLSRLEQRQYGSALAASEPVLTAEELLSLLRRVEEKSVKSG